MIGNLAFGTLLATVAFAQAATTNLPPTDSPQAIGWWVIIAVAVIIGADKVLDFFKKHMREQPSPSNTYLTIPNFEKIEAERKADREKILTKLGEIETSIASSNRYQAKARQGIHRRVNAMGNALSFIAGRFFTQGDRAGAQAIENKLSDADGGGDEA